MSSNKHILIFSPGFPRDEEDYFCIPPLQAYLPALRKERPDLKVTVVALHYPYEERTYQWHGFEVHALGGNNVSSPTGKFLLWRKARRRLRQLHKAHPVQAIHSLWLTECSWLAQQVGRKLSIPVVATVQGQDALKANRYLSSLDLNKIKVVTLSQRAADLLQRSRMVPDVRVIPWGLPSEDVADHILSPRDVDVIGVGNLVDVKNWSHFLAVLERLRRNKPFAKAKLIGDGRLRAALEQEAEDRQLTGMLEFTGELPRPEVLQLMRRSKVLLHTARYEGQGYIFEEALASGMRIVSTSVGMAAEGPRWSLGETAEELAEALAEALSEPTLQDPGPFDSIEETVRAYLEVYGC